MATTPKILEVLSPSARAWIESEVETYGLTDEIDYLNRLIESVKRAKEELRADVIQGIEELERGDCGPLTTEQVKEMGREAQRKNDDA